MMSRFWTKWKKQLLGTLLVVVCGILLFFILQHLGLLKSGTRKILNILSPFVYGGIIAYLLDPLCNRIEDGILWLLGHTRLQKKKQASIAWMGSILLSLVLLIAMIGFLMAMVLPQLATSITRLVNAIPGYAADIYDALLPLVERFGLETQLAVFRSGHHPAVPQRGGHRDPAAQHGQHHHPGWRPGLRRGHRSVQCASGFHRQLLLPEQSAHLRSPGQEADLRRPAP